MHTAYGSGKIDPDYKAYMDTIKDSSDESGFCRTNLDDPSKGNKAGCGYGAETSEIAFHYQFTFGVNKAHRGKTFTFVVQGAYDGAYMVMDSELMAEATKMVSGDKLYVQCTLGEGEHVLELYAFAFEDTNPIWTYAVDGSEEQAMTMHSVNTFCPVEIKYPESDACSKNTVLMPTKPLYSEGYLEKGKMVIWSMKMRHKQKMVSKTTGESDIDLYLRWNDCPTTSKYNERGFTTKGNETESFQAPEDGTLYIGVRGYKSSGYTLATTCDGKAAMCEDLWTNEEKAEYRPGRTNDDDTMPPK